MLPPVVNAGTGEGRTFKDVAKALMAVHGEDGIRQTFAEEPAKETYSNT